MIITTFKSQSSIKVTKEGNFSGWKELYNHLDNENDRAKAEAIAGKMPVYKKPEPKPYYKVSAEH